MLFEVTLEESNIDTKKRELITIIIPSLRLGGTEQQLIHLVNSYQNSEWLPQLEVEIVLLNEGTDFPREIIEVLPITYLDSRGSYLRTIFNLGRHLRKRKPDVVYGLLAPANFLIGLESFIYRRGRYVWGIRSSKHTVGITFPRRLLHDLAYRVLQYRIAVILCNSVASATYATQVLGLSSAKVTTVPNFLATPPELDYQVCRHEVRCKLGLSSSDFVLVNISRLVPDKGLMDLLEVMRTVSIKTHSIKLIIAGDGHPGYVESLKTMAAELDVAEQVRWVGLVTNPWTFLSAADCYISTSISESSSNSLQEAHLIGLPLVSTDAGDAADFVRQDNLCEVGDIDGLSKRVLALSEQSGAEPRFVIHHGVLMSEIRTKNNNSLSDLMRCLLQT